MRGTLFWGPYNKDPTIQGTISGSPIFGNSLLDFTVTSSGACCFRGFFELVRLAPATLNPQTLILKLLNPSDPNP